MNHLSSPRFGRGAALATSALVALLATLQQASAVTQYWDPGLTPTANSGKGSGGDGTWTSGGVNWSTGTIDAALTATNVAGFAGTGGTVALTTVIGPSTANGLGGLLFESNNYTIGSGSAASVLNLSAAANDGISVLPGVTGTVIDVGGIRVGGTTPILFTNTDLIDFKNTLIYFSGSRTIKINNSSASATTTFARFAPSDKGVGGTWPNANLALDTGNLVINSLSSSATNGTSTMANYASATVVNTTFSGNTTGTLTVNGNNTLFNNNGTGIAQLTLTVNLGNGTLALGHDNALGALKAGDVATNTAVLLQTGALAASGGARTIANAVSITGNNARIGGSENLTLSGNFTATNSVSDRTLTVNNSAVSTLSGNVFLAADNTTARTFTIAGTGNLIISGAIANNSGVNTVASGLTLNGTGNTLTLSNSGNTYSGATTITAGTLAFGVNNALSPNSALSLGAAKLDAKTFSALAPSLALTSASATLKFDFTGRPINNTTAFIGLSGGFTESSDLSGYTLDFSGFTFSAEGAYKLLSFTSITGTLLVGDIVVTNLNLSGVTGALSLTGTDLSFVTTSAVPEPSTYAALAGLFGLGYVVLRRRRRA